jgi:hypothetical protein
VKIHTRAILIVKLLRQNLVIRWTVTQAIVQGHFELFVCAETAIVLAVCKWGSESHAI